MYCNNCGRKIEHGQRFCPNCSPAKTEGDDDDVYVPMQSGGAEKYKPHVVKLSVLALCAQAISLLLVVALLFLPIYTCTPSDMDAIQNLEDVEELFLNDGKLNFSLFDEITLIMGAIIPGEGEDSDNGFSPEMFMVLDMGLFALLQVIMMILLIIPLVITTFEQISNLRNADDYALLRYDEIKKTGTSQIKPSFWKNQTALSIVLYAIFDVIYTKAFGGLFSGIVGVGFYRYMIDFSGVSIYASVVIILAMALFVVKNVSKRAEKAMHLSIAKE